MEQLTCLIRTSYRPKQFPLCGGSIILAASRLENKIDVRIIVSYDDQRAMEYLMEERPGIKYIPVQKTRTPFGYNLYCNDLLQEVHSGHAMFIDDDDTVLPNAFNQLQLEPGLSYIVPFKREHTQKPTPAMMQLQKIHKGYIGLPCLIVWHEHIKHLSFTATETTDYDNILHLSSKTPLCWRNWPVVNSPARSYGKML